MTATKEKAPIAGGASNQGRTQNKALAGDIVADTPLVDHTEAERLFNLGFKMCKLLPYSKQPVGESWNQHPIKSFDHNATGYGVLLAANGLCSVDPDKGILARQGLAALGFDLDAIMAAGIQSTSTRPDSGGRSAFKALDGLQWKTFRFKETGTVLELRAKSANLQDAVPGLIYRNGEDSPLYTQRYASALRLDAAPVLPRAFAQWWLRVSTDLDFLHDQQKKMAQALGLTAQLDVSSGGKHLAFTSAMRESFNASHDVETILMAHNYTLGTNERYSPPTATGKAGVRRIPGKADLWQSDHASDPLFGTFDAWTAFVVLEHDGNQPAAEAAAEPGRLAAIADDFRDWVGEGRAAAEALSDQIDCADLLGLSNDELLAEVQAKKDVLAFAEQEAMQLMRKLSTRPGMEGQAVKQAVGIKPCKFEVIPASEFAAGPPPAWIVRDVLPEAALCVIYG
jgi:hypothetical protein